MAGKRIQNLWIDNNEPLQTNVVWIRPNWGIFYYDEGRWIPILGSYSTLLEDLIVEQGIGGISSEDFYPKGTLLEKILRDLFTSNSGGQSSSLVGTGTVGYMIVG